MTKKRWALLVLALMMTLTAACALAKTEPNSKTMEESNTYDYGTVQIRIERWMHAFNKTELRYYLAHIHVDDPAQLQTAFAGEEYSKDNAEAPSDIGARHDAVITINGDYYNFKDKNGLIIRNGVLYRDAESTRHQLLIYQDGRFELLMPENYKKGEGQKYIDAGVVQSFSFGPALVDNGEILELPKKYYIYTKDTVREPRTGIGQIDEHNYVFLVADGRRDGWSDLGMSLQEMQEIFAAQGCRVAYNLDGGGSAAMILDGERVNKGSGSRERNVSDIVYIAR